jgi:hypothetical protein
MHYRITLGGCHRAFPGRSAPGDFSPRMGKHLIVPAVASAAHDQYIRGESQQPAGQDCPTATDALICGCADLTSPTKHYSVTQHRGGEPAIDDQLQPRAWGDASNRTALDLVRDFMRKQSAVNPLIQRSRRCPQRVAGHCAA